MKTIMITLLAMFLLSGCGSDDVEFSEASKKAKDTDLGVDGFTNKELAELASPTGEVCEFGEIIEIFIPANRGKNGKGEFVTIDNRTYEPAYHRMDVNFDGLFNKDDSALATKRIYQKQLNSEVCPAVADISQFEGEATFDPDTWFTSNDINLWRYVHKTGDFQLKDELICLSECEILNHMDPNFKH